MTDNRSNDLLRTVLNVIKEAAGVPVTPAPLRRESSAVTYRWHPGGGDGTLNCARIDLRFTAFSLDNAVETMKAVRRAMLGADGSFAIGEGAERLTIRESLIGSGSGYIRGCGLYYVKTSFDIQGRGDIYG